MVLATLVFLFTLSNKIVTAQGSYLKICEQGISIDNSGNRDGAIAKFTEAISLKPGLWEAYSYRAKVYYRQQKPDLALSDINQAITLSPSNTSLYEVRAEILGSKGMNDKAAEDYSTVIAKTGGKDPHLFDLYFSRGQQYYQAGKYDQAIGDFTQTIAVAASHGKDASEVYSHRAISYFKTSRFAESVRDFDQYLASGKTDANAYFYQGLALMKTNDQARARTNAQKLIELDPSKEIMFSGDKLLGIFDLDMRRKMTDQSIAEAQAMLKEEKTITSRSLANIKLNDAFRALNNALFYCPGLEQADRDKREEITGLLASVHARLKPKPEVPEAARKYMVQANSATTEKRYQDAIALWNKVQSIAPWYPNSWFNKALIYEYLNDFRSSIANMNKYLELYPDAEDVRAAKDKIYEWEGKAKNQPPAPAVAASAIMRNNPMPMGSGKPKVFLKGGLTMPSGNSALTPASAPSTEAALNAVFFDEGTIGIKQGYFIEAGLDLMSLSKPRVVRFYYHPLILGFSQNALDWSSLAGIFSNAAIYTKPVSLIEVAQRYGVGFVPRGSKFIGAVYYRPAFVIPLTYQIYHEGTTPAMYSIAGDMSSEKVFNLSHTLGFSLGYSFVSFSYELYSVKAGYDIREVIKAQSNSPQTEYNITGRVPVKMNRIGVSLTF